MVNSEPTLVEKLRKLPSLRLLHMRAEGESLADEWHRAIEVVFAERNEYLPPIPTQPIAIGPAKPNHKGDAVVFSVMTWAGWIIVKALEVVWLIIPIVATLLVFYLGKHIRRNFLPENVRAAEVAVEQANKQEMNELMRCAADGDLRRVRELLNFGAYDVNSRCALGATALIYAARNGNGEIIDMLLVKGAHTHIVTNKGTSAAATARQFGHHAIANRLDQSV